MSGESLGTAYLQLSVDTAEFEARISRARDIGKSLGPEVANAFVQADSKTRQHITSLGKYVETLGLTQDQVKLLRAAWAGVDTGVIENIGKKIADVRQQAELLAIKTQHAADGEAFAKMAADAERLRRGQEAVAAFTEHLDLMEIKAQHAADGAAFERMAEEAERLRRGQQAVAAFTEQLDQLEQAEAHAASQGAFLKNLESQTNAIGKTRAELMEMKAAELGVADAAAPFIAKMKESEAALMNGGKQFNAYGKSAKEVQLALRQVPAQITDIFVSLQGGQAPLTVLLQQGGQLRDVFGGITPAAQALGGALLKLINPWTLVAAAIAGVGYAMIEGQDETEAFARAIALVGDHAGVSVGELQTMSIAMRDNTRTQHDNAEALAKVVESGKFVADQYQVVATAAVNMQNATGQSVEKTVEIFARLADDPVKAVQKLNSEQHFLTEGTMAQIKALQEQGDTQAAATVAMDAYADAVNKRSEDVRAHLGTLQTAWLDIKTVAKAAWDAMLDVGREDTLDEKIRHIGDNLDKLKNDPTAFLQLGGLGSQARQQEIARQRKELQGLLRDQQKGMREEFQANARQEAVDYEAAQEVEILSHKSADAKREAEISRSRKESDKKIARAMAAGMPELADTIRKNQKAYEAALNSEHPKSSAVPNAQLKSDLQDFKDILAEQQDAIRNDTRILQSEYTNKTVTIEAYYDGLSALAHRNTKAQEDAINGELAVLRSRNATGKDQIDIERQIGQLESKLRILRADAAAEDKLNASEKARALKQEQDSIDQYIFALDQQNIAMARQVAAQVAAIGMGQQEAALHQRIADIYAHEADELARLEYLKQHNQISGKEYDAEKAAIQQKTDDAVQIQRDGYAAMLVAQQDWLGGVYAGLQDWFDATANVSSQMREMTTHDMDTIADALTNAAETGKLEWRNMLIDMLKELEKFLIKQAMLKAAYAVADYVFGGSGSGGEQIYAKGGVIDGSSSLHSYVNGVYDSPQHFAFAKGGVFAEAGPEAIMPLARDSSGRLGVEVHGGAGGGGVGAINMSINTTLHSDGSANTETKASDQDAALKQFSSHMAGVAQQEIRKATQPGGMLWKIGVQG